MGRSFPLWAHMTNGTGAGACKACCSMKGCGVAVVLGGDYKSPAPSVCSIERGSNGGLGPFEWAQSGKPRVLELHAARKWGLGDVHLIAR